MAAAAPDMEAVIEKGVAELSQALPDCDPAQLRQMVTGVTHLSAADLIVALIAALAERVELSQKLKVCIVVFPVAVLLRHGDCEKSLTHSR